MKIGYIRISTMDQNTARQEVLMQELGVDQVFIDRMSGKNLSRPELNRMLTFVREGDTVIVESISRFARNTRDLLELVAKLTEKGVEFVSKKEAIDTNTPSGKFMLTIFGAVADKAAYTQKEYDEVYKFAKEHPDGLAIMVLMETGISRSELLGLRWEDIDVKSQVIHIRQGLVSYQDLDEKSWVTEASGLKNAYRRRDVPIVDKDLMDRLSKKPRAIILKKGEHSAERIVSTEYVFHSPEGQAYQPNNWRNRVFTPFMEDLLKKHPELPELSAHELRHTRATLWLAQGISPLMVAKLLGHSDTKMLSKVYDHTTVDTLREAIVGSKKKNDDNKEAG